MPGKMGVKLIPRLSTTKKFHSLRELVFNTFEKRPTISKEEMEDIIRKEYPKANFFSRDGKGGHFTWYKHKWNKAKLEKEFTLIGNIDGNVTEGTDDGGTQRDESKKDRKRDATKLGSKEVGRPRHREKNRRVQVHKNKKQVGVKARKTILKRKRTSTRSRQSTKT